MDSNNLIAQRRRNRAILRLRLWSGIKDAVTKPWKGILVLLLCAAFIFLWNIRDTLVPFHSNIPLLSTIWGYIIAVLIPLLFLLLLVGLLFLMGTPLRAKSIEDSLRQIDLTNSYGYTPVLISRKHMKNTNVTVMTFYSLGVGMKKWETHSTEIQDVLNIHFVQPIKYGGKNEQNRNIIAITSAPGTETHREDVLYDDEL